METYMILLKNTRCLKNDVNEKKYDSYFDDYRKINIEEIRRSVDKKLGDPPMDQKTSQFHVSELMWAFGELSL